MFLSSFVWQLFAHHIVLSDEFYCEKNCIFGKQKWLLKWSILSEHMRV